MALRGLDQVLRFLHLESKDIEMIGFLRKTSLMVLFALISHSAAAQPHD